MEISDHVRQLSSEAIMAHLQLARPAMYGGSPTWECHSCSGTVVLYGDEADREACARCERCDLQVGIDQIAELAIAHP